MKIPHRLLNEDIFITKTFKVFIIMTARVLGVFIMNRSLFRRRADIFIGKTFLLYRRLGIFIIRTMSVSFRVETGLKNPGPRAYGPKSEFWVTGRARTGLNLNFQLWASPRQA